MKNRYKQSYSEMKGLGNRNLYLRRAESFFYRKNLEFRKYLFSRNVIPRFVEWGIFQPNIRMVEIGCGHGDKLHLIFQNAKEGSTLIGLDVSSEMLIKGKAKYPDLANIMFQGDAFKLDKLVGKYNVLFYLQILQHFTKDQVKKCLTIAKAYLKSNGKIVVMNTFVPEKPLSRKIFLALKFLYAKLFTMNPDEYRNLTESEFVKIADGVGFRLTKRTSAGFTIRALLLNLID